MDILLNYATNIVLLTGAGCSTGVGIPDFRGNGTSSEERPDFTKFSPGKVHDLISKFVKAGKVKMIITQNIDDLHRNVPSDKLIELHGNALKSRCTTCGSTVYETCPCGGRLLLPSVVQFDTPLFTEDINRAEKAVETCDLMIVMGTSLKVYPANSLPNIILKKGGNVVVVNKDPTSLDDVARIVYQCDVLEVLEEMERIWNQEAPILTPTKLKGFKTYNHTIDVWMCKECTFENRFFPTSCEACGHDKQ
jgi:NAD-dependent deacetylase